MFNEALVSFRSQVMFTIFKTILDKKAVASRFGDVGINKSTCVSILFIALKQFEWEMQLFDCCLFVSSVKCILDCAHKLSFLVSFLSIWVWKLEFEANFSTINCLRTYVGWEQAMKTGEAASRKNEKHYQFVCKRPSNLSNMIIFCSS